MSTTFDSGEPYRRPQLHDKVSSDVRDTLENQKERQVGTEWNWGGAGKAVALTEEDVKLVIGRIIEAVTQKSQSDLFEQFKQFARQEAELAGEREKVVRLTGEVAALRGHIHSLNAFVANMTPVPGGSFSFIRTAQAADVTTHPVTTFQDRFAASAPVPQIPPPPGIE